ncbi:Origin recognition complex subunit 2 [Sphaceloma murrayae]|uniref:Origin recognition complex subunit 2 n=1 Tax=Sphaceloma murrayae TaxID=2082308 RepID=A0A2K1QKY9_9PEZI|nr:Origin recognition complex subunit 2 [Sphaceloma murrayae]
MARKRVADTAADGEQTPKKRKSVVEAIQESEPAVTSPSQTPSKLRSILKTADDINGEATPKSVRKVLFSQPGTPQEQDDPTSHESPLAKARRLDSSARRKSNRRLMEQGNEDGEDHVEDDEALAEEILAAEEAEDDPPQLEEDITPAPDTPSKTPRPRGRPKGRRKERTPTPDFDMPPHELYFFQNRAGGAKTSTNTLPSSALLNHETYFTKMAGWTDPHASAMSSLDQHHHRAFSQWTFELSESFSLCLHGYGSKRHLLTSFAAHVHATTSPAPHIMIINGYNPSLTPRSILTLLSTLAPSLSLPSNPQTAISALVSHLLTDPPKSPSYLLINSLDARPIRKHLPLLGPLASVLRIVATVDTPTFPLLFPLPLLSQFRFLFHDATTFRPFEAEVEVVDEVNVLLGKSGRRVGGKDGVVFVLKSLPENARGLFRILVGEQLGLMEEAGVLSLGDGDGEEEGGQGMFGAEDRGDWDEDEDEEDDVDEDRDEDAEMAMGKRPRGRWKKAPVRTSRKKTKTNTKTKAARRAGEERVEGVEYRMLYHKAVEEFVCSSEMGFRTLLKEFYDHRIVESRRDASGTERLVVPFGRGELEGLLEELI